MADVIIALVNLDIGIDPVLVLQLAPVSHLENRRIREVTWRLLRMLIGSAFIIQLVFLCGLLVLSAYL